MKFYLSAILLFWVINVSYGQSQDSCKLFFDFGYGDEPHCDSNLVKAGCFSYDLWNNGGVTVLAEMNFFADSVYSDADIAFYINDTGLTVEKKIAGAIVNSKKYSLTKLYAIAKGKEYRGKERVWSNGYKIEVSGRIFYLLFIRPTAGCSYIIAYRGILIDASAAAIQVIPLPDFQSSNSAKCLVQIDSSNLGYISCNLTGNHSKNVFLYRYRDGKFHRDASHQLVLIPYDGFLYKIDRTNSKWK